MSPYYAPEELFRLIEICRQEILIAEMFREDTMKMVAASRMMIKESRNLMLAADLTLSRS
jgi:hypothetical protein